MRTTPPVARRGLAILVVIAALAALATVHARQDARIVAIGDIHGAAQEFAAILRAAKLTDSSDRWIGGKATLVQTGDYTDRGAGVRAVMDLLIALEAQSRSAGGRLMVLLGNHEVMNLLGEQRDVTPEIYATFADKNSESLRLKAWDQYTDLAAARAKLRPATPAAVYGQTREAWMAAHPPGWLEYRAAFAPNGKYGGWLRQKPIFAKVGGALFMHAGINPTGTPAPKAEAANDQVRNDIRRVDRHLQRLVAAKLALPFFTLDEILQASVAEIQALNAVLAAAKQNGEEPDLTGFDLMIAREANEMLKIGEWAPLAPAGPMWYRGYAQDDEAALEGPVTATLAANGVSRLVLGHTPQSTWRITPRLGSRIVLIDTGMLTSVYKGRPSALELAGGQLTAIYEDGQMPIEKLQVQSAKFKGGQAVSLNQATVRRSPSSNGTSVR
jgi:hypothetical protein